MNDFRIIQITTSSDTENGTTILGLGNDGNLYEYRYQTLQPVAIPNARWNTDAHRVESAPGETFFRTGWTPGWSPLPSGISRTLFHPDDPKRNTEE